MGSSASPNRRRHSAVSRCYQRNSRPLASSPQIVLVVVVVLVLGCFPVLEAKPPAHFLRAFRATRSSIVLIGIFRSLGTLRLCGERDRLTWLLHRSGENKRRKQYLRTRQTGPGEFAPA